MNASRGSNIVERSPQIAVIVPCHNIEAYVPACLESLAAQTFTDFEAVLVDDGSSDATGEILDAFVATHTNFRVIHQENQGLSVARNVGVAASKAPLLAFVDGDDYVDCSYLEILHSALTSHDADIACCGFKRIREGSAPVPAKTDPATVAIEVLSAQDALKQIALEKIQLAAWSKLIKRELIEEHLFPAGKVYEDLYVIGLVVSSASKIVRTPQPLYYYVSHPKSITRGRRKSLKTFWDFHDAIAVFEDAYQQALGFSHATDDPSYCIHLVHRVCGLYTTLLNTECSQMVRAELEAAVHDELEAVFQLAVRQGVSRMNPQMIRAAILLRNPALHQAALFAYRRLIFQTS